MGRMAKIREHYLGESKAPPLKIGTPIILLRPSLWSGAAGVVESWDEYSKLHTVRIAGKNNEKFSTEAPVECLKVDYKRMMTV